MGVTNSTVLFTKRANMQTANTIRFLLQFLSVVLVASGGHIARAEPLPMFDFPRLVESSDLVARLAPLEIPDQFQVVRVYFGNAAKPGESISLRDTDSELKEAHDNHRPICAFLKAEDVDKGYFRLSSSHYGWFRVRMSPPEKVATGKEAIEGELIAGLSSDDAKSVEDSVTWIERMRSVEGRKMIMMLAEGSNPHLLVRASYLMENVPKGELSTLEAAVDVLRKLREQKSGSRLEAQLGWAFSKIKESKSVGYLNKLLADPDSGVMRPLAYSSRDWADSSTTVSGRSKPATKGRIKTSHYNGVICSVDSASRMGRRVHGKSDRSGCYSFDTNALRTRLVEA
jgi:hypothetical protein